MLWPLNDPCSADNFVSRRVSEVLYEFDGPKIFLTDAGPLQYLWYEAAEDAETGVLRYLVAPTDRRMVEGLKSGARTVYDALNQPWLWAVDIDQKDEIIEAGVLTLEEVPTMAKPEKSATLWPQLEPLLSYRLIGDGLREGNVPASVAARALERPAAALKRLFESVRNTTAHGRPEESVRKVYDLPARRFAFNSFEVAFGPPNEPELLLSADGESVYGAAARGLQEAVDWLRSPDQEGRSLPSIQLLEVLKELAPPAHGQVVRAEISGQMVANGMRVSFTRDDRNRVTQAITKKREIQRALLRTEGRIGEFDKDELTFILRDREDSQLELRCSFSEEQYDDLYDAFVSDRRVELLGRLQQARNVLEVIAVEPLIAPSPDSPSAPA
jgi:hypothetical protein